MRAAHPVVLAGDLVPLVAVVVAMSASGCAPLAIRRCRTSALRTRTESLPSRAAWRRAPPVGRASPPRQEAQGAPRGPLRHTHWKHRSQLAAFTRLATVAERRRIVRNIVDRMSRDRLKQGMLQWVIRWTQHMGIRAGRKPSCLAVALLCRVSPRGAHLG